MARISDYTFNGHGLTCNCSRGQFVSRQRIARLWLMLSAGSSRDLSLIKQRPPRLHKNWHTQVLFCLFPQAKAGLGMNILAVTVLVICINTYGVVMFDLSTFPDWAASGASPTPTIISGNVTRVC